jgi:formylglycine-generating enzyme required for sulfatase activity
LGIAAFAVMLVFVFAGCKEPENDPPPPPPPPTDSVINISAIQGVTAPVKEATPITNITQNDQYSGTVTWSPSHSTFTASTVYTATITLTAKTGYTLQGVGANFFTVTGATSVSNSANSGVITVVFPSTSANVINIAAIQGVTAPSNGRTPVTSITQNDQYSGTVAWSPNDSTFAPVTQYTATITLTPKTTDYTLQGVSANFFTVDGATSVSNAVNSGIITAVFPATEATPITNAEIIITAPVKGVTPNTTASSDADNFTVGTVSWLPIESPFKGGIVYTATVTLTANNGFTFNGLTTATINGQTGNVTNNNGTVVTLSYTFPATNEKTVNNLTVKTQPTKLTYTHEDTLDLTGLVVTLTYDDTTTEDVTAANFTAKNITANPAHGNQLTHSTNNGSPITVSYGSLQKTTNNLTVNPKVINIAVIQGVTAPVKGATPITNITQNDQYSGTVAWSPNDSTFAHVTQYTATITLTAKSDYTLQGVGANFFTVAGATSVSNSANSGVITAVFPATEATVINISAIQGVIAPVTGGTPIVSIIENTQYTGTVTWSPTVAIGGKFASVTDYTATITLTAKHGYTLQGVGQNFFTVEGALATNNANSGAITAVFPQTAPIVINISAIQGVTVPVTGNTPVVSITENAQYSGTVTWSSNNQSAVGTFDTAKSIYTATITLTAKHGYTLQGVAANFFTVADAVSVSNAANSGVVTAVFPLITMIYVPGGSFQMGDTKNNNLEANEKPVHTVTLTGFYMGKYEITQSQYRAVMNKDARIGEGFGTGADFPTYGLTWYETIVFCNKLSIAEGLNPAYLINNSTNPSDWGAGPTIDTEDPVWKAVEIVGGSNGYRLPTEAQWEYAAKGGDGSPGNYTYSGSDTLTDVSLSISDFYSVGRKMPNGLGIYDMTGNVAEYCWDWLGDYSDAAQIDPVGPDTGTKRVNRGGGLYTGTSSRRSAYRYSFIPHDWSRYIGMRLVRP